MTDTLPYFERRQLLEASFDGPVPAARLREPHPRRRPADASAVMRSITARRRALTAAEARADAVLARLGLYLAWLVQNDRRR